MQYLSCRSHTENLETRNLDTKWKKTVDKFLHNF